MGKRCSRCERLPMRLTSFRKLEAFPGRVLTRDPPSVSPQQHSWCCPVSWTLAETLSGRRERVHIHLPTSSSDLSCPLHCAARQKKAHICWITSAFAGLPWLPWLCGGMILAHVWCVSFSLRDKGFPGGGYFQSLR